MRKTFNSGITCIVMSEKDNVVTLLRDVKENEHISFELNGREQKLIVKQDVDFGHKIALRTIEKAETIFKYGESIGVATTTIQAGEHVHIHNLGGVRGRGDQ
ncbi:UxaA family hydrolase [Halalkalibacter urbisdiaboli]|uniref:UxaA family hydrolase n=1 Tax=Halalkalibacter urbisdiaboli TaxID=1960589 RepID=UPI001FDA6331|nr:UxaA family hydrolase [Halalkalibacter urbisdiaboli]